MLINLYILGNFFVKSHHDFEVQVTCIKIGQSGVTYPTATDREWRRGKSKHSGFPTFYFEFCIFGELVDFFLFEIQLSQEEEVES